MKYFLATLLLVSAAHAKIDLKTQPTKKLVKECMNIVIEKNDICSHQITQTKLEDKSLELTEDLLEKLDQKGLKYDIIRVSNESKLHNCKDINDNYKSQICVDRKKINTMDKKDTALLVEDLF